MTPSQTPAKPNQHRAAVQATNPRKHTHKRTTLTDVGRAVGVSAKTVSNVVNGSGWVSDEVRNRVLAAIDELGYQPNLAARQLRTGASPLVSLALPDLKEPYFAEMAAAFVDAAEERSLRVFISQTRGKIERERDAIEGIGLPDLAGIIISPLELTPTDLQARKSSAPLTLIGEFGGEIYSGRGRHVGIDNVAAAQAATEHLINHGCRRIAVIGVQKDQSRQTSVQRYRGYRQALTAHGLTFDPALVGNVDVFTRAQGSAAVEQVLNSGHPFDGMFCFSDTLAFGAVYALAAHKLSVPHDVRLIGFDNIEEGKFSIPLFDTVDPEVATLAATCLDLIGNPSMPPGSITIPHHIVSRTNP